MGATAVNFATGFHQKELVKDHAEETGQKITNVGKKGQHQRDADNGVDYGSHFATTGVWCYVTITYKTAIYFTLTKTMNILANSGQKT